MKKINLSIIITSLFLVVISTILFHFGALKNINTYIIVIPVICALLIILLNAMKNWSKAIIISILAFLIVMGCGKFALLAGYTATYAYTQINNYKQISNITSLKNTTKVFSYDEYDYYINSSYSYLYKVKQEGIKSTVDVTSIIIEKDAGSVLSEYFGLFYEVNNNTKFSHIGDFKISVSPAIGTKDEIIFLKLINNDNKVFYTYLKVDNKVQFLQDIGIVKDIYTIGNTNFLVSKNTKVIDGTSDPENVESSASQQYLFTISNNKIMGSLLTNVEFSGDVGYHSRINYYIHREAFLNIELCEQAMIGLDPASDEYLQLENTLAETKASIQNYTCELCFEKTSGDYQIRLYRTFLPTGGMTEVPDISIIELKFGNTYSYALVDLTLDELQ